MRPLDTAALGPVSSISANAKRTEDARIVREALAQLAREEEAAGREAGCLVELARLPHEVLAKLRRLLR